MSLKSTSVHNLDVGKSDDNGDETPKTVRRFIKRRWRDLHVKAFGVTVKFRQQDEQGSEDT